MLQEPPNKHCSHIQIAGFCRTVPSAMGYVHCLILEQSTQNIPPCPHPPVLAELAKELVVVVRNLVLRERAYALRPGIECEVRVQYTNRGFLLVCDDKKREIDILKLTICKINRYLDIRKVAKS